MSGPPETRGAGIAPLVHWGRDRLLFGLYQLGWRAGHRMPPRLVRASIRLLSSAAVRQNGVHVATLRRNLAILSGGDVDDDLARRAVASHLRNVFEMLALPGWTASAIRRGVRVLDEPMLRAAYADRGIVVALPHSGNWDLAGAWACLTGMPVTTVAEELPGPAYRAFVAFRERLGMKVLSHRDPGVIAELISAVRRGRVVCLLADRDLAGRGLAVRFAERPVTMPAGPAVVARRAGALLVPAVCRFAGKVMVIVIGEPIAPRPGREGLIEMTQEVADFFTRTLAEQPEDWHMMQKFFSAEDAGGE
jgi:phosphatidylinositol dimannoside acyltransferase